MLRQFYIKNIKRGALYFVAIIPPSPIYEEALGLKNHFKEKYQSKASLNSPPHITLHMPFQWKEDKEDELLSTFEKLSPVVKPFKLKLSGFGSFPPRVLFIDVDKNESLVNLHQNIHQQCKRELNVFNANYKDKAFHPHLTLAFRDLKKPMYAKAWEEFEHKDFNTEFSVDKFALLKHNGKVWEVYKEFFFEN
ncbi:MAG TPA: RNA 2',3'-cyclic phosphodiesterase [Cyclobacteriaceae bacterium]|jgi:2'-5' RNA ligase|nr:RNA 2',3'-cyclic phosphodiesterase [Cyclobacteriaceae bacterium]